MRQPLRERSSLLTTGGCCCAAVFAAVVVLAGCQDPLFPHDAPRTQFEIYDRMRDNYAPADQPDVFGKPQPALRQRLQPS